MLIQKKNLVSISKEWGCLAVVAFKERSDRFFLKVFQIFAAKFPDALPKYSTEALPPALLERAFQYPGSTDEYEHWAPLARCTASQNTVQHLLGHHVCEVVLGPIR